MLHVFLKFSVFLVIIMVAFTFGMGTLYRYYRGMVQVDPVTGETTRQEDSFVTVTDTFKTLFWGIFGMSPLESPDVVIGNAAGKEADGADDGPSSATPVRQHYFTQLVGHGLFVAFEVLMVIVMLNTLIASVSNAFQRVVDSEYESLFGRTKVYVNYMLLDDLPPPFNLLSLAAGLAAGYRERWKREVADQGGGGGTKDDEDDEDDNYEDDPAKTRALMAELIKRYFTHKEQADKSADG